MFNLFKKKSNVEKLQEKYEKLMKEWHQFSRMIRNCLSHNFKFMFNNYDKGMDMAKNLSKEVSIVIYKKGERGSVTFYDNKEINKGIFSVKALKPTGAGDAFIGSFIGALLNNKNVVESIIYGSASAAIVVTKVGCAPAMPLQKEIEEFMKLNTINN